MKEDVFFDLGSEEEQIESNSDVSRDFLVEDDEEIDNKDIAALKQELMRLSKLNDL